MTQPPHQRQHANSKNNTPTVTANTLTTIYQRPVNQPPVHQQPLHLQPLHQQSLHQQSEHHTNNHLPTTTTPTTIPPTTNTPTNSTPTTRTTPTTSTPNTTPTPTYLLLDPLVLSGFLRVENEIAGREALLLAPPLELRYVVGSHAGLEVLAVMETRLKALRKPSRGGEEGVRTSQRSKPRFIRLV